MSIAARSLIRSALVACAFGALGLGCGASADGERTVAAGEALTSLPQAICTWIAGTQDPEAQVAAVWSTLTVGGYAEGIRAPSTSFSSSTTTGEGGGYDFKQVVNGRTGRWYAIDVTHSSKTTMTNIVDEKSNALAPRYAGYYTCAYDWTHYLLPPGQPRPYVPSAIVAYQTAPTDPRGCGSGCQ